MCGMVLRSAALGASLRTGGSLVRLRPSPVGIIGRPGSVEALVSPPERRNRHLLQPVDQVEGAGLPLGAQRPGRAGRLGPKHRDEVATPEPVDERLTQAGLYDPVGEHGDAGE